MVVYLYAHIWSYFVGFVSWLLGTNAGWKSVVSSGIESPCFKSNTFLISGVSLLSRIASDTFAFCASFSPSRNLEKRRRMEGLVINFHVATAARPKRGLPKYVR